MPANTESRRPDDQSDTELFRAHHATVERIVRARVPRASNEAIEDAAQYAWAELVRRPPADRAHVIDWLVKVALNNLLRSLRREGRHELLTDRPCAFHDPRDVADPLAIIDARLAVASGWDRLTSDQRFALTLWARGFSYEEVAELGHRSYWWAHWHIRGGLRALRRFVGDIPR